METNNPVLARMEREAKNNGGYAPFGATATATAAPVASRTDAAVAQQQHDGATAPPVVTGPPMTIPDVIAKSALMFVVVVAFATVSWQMEINYALILVSMFGALGLGLWAALSSKVRPVLYLAYAALMGFAIGGISLWYSTWATENGAESNIVYQAVIGTFAAFAAMLFLYATRIIKVNGTFKKAMAIALVAYLGIAIVSFISSFFGVGDGWGFYGVGGLGVLLCVAGVGLAAFSLALDFDAIETAIAARAPERESWRAAFGLTVTLIWLYLELLRLLAILNSE